MLQVECRSIHIKKPVGLIDVARIAKRRSTLEEQLKSNDREMWNINRGYKFVSSAVIEMQHLILSKVAEAWLYPQQILSRRNEGRAALPRLRDGCLC